jgi:hypothetical protein
VTLHRPQRADVVRCVLTRGSGCAAHVGSPQEFSGKHPRF